MSDMSILKEHRHEVEVNFKEICERELPKIGLNLYDVNFRPSTGELTVFIFDPKSGTAIIDDCVKVDQILTPYIESESWVPEKFTLEVSSPGVYRHLNSLWHFERSIGENAEFVLNRPFDEQNIVEKKQQELKGIKGNTKFRGKISEVEKSAVVVDLGPAKVRLPYEIIKKANIDHQ